MFELEKALTEISRLKSYFTDIQREVQLYEQLYCSQESLAVMNKTLTPVFLILKRSMFISILTRVSAVFDSKSFGVDPNLCLAFLEDKYREHLSGETISKFQALNDKYKSLNIKKFRNKLIAHNDFAAVFNPGAVTHTIKQGDIDGLLVEAREFCVSLCQDLPGGIDTIFQVMPWQLQPGNDGKELIRRVEVGTGAK